jgi:hypothetical protein
MTYNVGDPNFYVDTLAYLTPLSSLFFTNLGNGMGPIISRSEILPGCILGISGEFEHQLWFGGYVCAGQRVMNSIGDGVE